MTYSIASESLGGGVCFQACLLVCKGLAYTLYTHTHPHTHTCITISAMMTEFDRIFCVLKKDSHISTNIFTNKLCG